MLVDDLRIHAQSNPINIDEKTFVIEVLKSLHHESMTTVIIRQDYVLLKVKAPAVAATQAPDEVDVDNPTRLTLT
jgi:hypothetical protein